MTSFLARLTRIKRLGGGLLGRLPTGRTRKISAILVALFLGLTIRLELTISGEFTVYPDHNADIRASVEGLIVEIQVQEGDTVEADTPIVRLENLDLLSKRQETRSAFARERARLDLLLAGTRAEEIQVARRELETAEARLAHSRALGSEAKRLRSERIEHARQNTSMAESNLAYAERERNRYQSLFANNIISEQRFDEILQSVTVRTNELKEAQTGLALAEADDLGQIKREKALAHGGLDEARAKLDVVLAGTRLEEIEAARSGVQGLEAQLANIDRQLQRLIVRTPMAGVVVTERLKERLGELVRPGDLIAEVYDFQIIRAEILIPEKEIGDVAIGQALLLKARAYPGRSFEGHVVSIAPRAIMSKNGVPQMVVRVTTEVANLGLALKPSMTGHGKIYAGERSVLYLITRRLVRYIRVEFWSWW